MVNYFCNECAKKQGLKRSMRQELKKCVYCGTTKLCSNDRPPKDFTKGGKKK